MAKDYNFSEIEAKWQKKWEADNYGISEDLSKKPKFYSLIEFPYPSGSGLHVGHCMMYSATDAHARMLRMKGYNVMYPMGWDAFGLPTENFAIKNKIKPQAATADNVATFKKQMKALGYSFDWSREINTTDPDYYQWTQWIFLQFYKHAITGGKLVKVEDDDTTTPRLAFQAEMPINWCPACKIGLANEEVIDGKCERCGAETERRMQKQWMLRITAYADRLIDDLATVDYLDKIKTQQINWIGRSRGAEIEFAVQSVSGNLKDEYLTVFTTRPDTLFGCTYMVISPEHPIIDRLKHQISNIEEIKKYQESSKKKSDLERTELQKEKTGIQLLGINAVNPVNNEEILIFTADYVLSTYGTGAIMAVPAHDERDWEFAKKFDLPIREVVIPEYGEEKEGEEERHTIIAIVKRKSDGKFLMLEWPKFNWIVPIIGGIENNEDMLKTAEREVYEETGYKVKAIEKIGVTTKSHFFAEHKNVKRLRYASFVLCELLSDEADEIAKEESDQHNTIWLAPEELNKLTFESNKVGFEWYMKGNYAFGGKGVVVNSAEFSGVPSDEAKDKIAERLVSMGKGKSAVNYKLRDWVFSRQHYWGEPIPIVYCANCAKTTGNHQETRDNNQKYAIVPVPEDQLPVVLPDVENYEPTDTGESPLAKITDWVNTVCPKCGGKATRETDTMPNWAGSSWYFLAYALSQKSKVKSQKAGNLFLDNKKELDYWMPVDLYNGGMEHTTLHLLYSRFWHKFLFDIGAVPGAEPYAKRIAHGIILGPDGQKMSKSKGNVINPDDIVTRYGADTLRTYIMFIGPYDQDSAWNPTSLLGVHRFLQRVWNQKYDLTETDEQALLVKINQTVRNLTFDFENFKPNTVISGLMELHNAIEKTGKISKDSYGKFLSLLYPAAPHIASELFQKTFGQDISSVTWPEVDKKYLIGENIEIVIQIGGKIRDKLIVPADIDTEELKKLALASDKVKTYIMGKEIKNVIVVPKKLVSIVL